MVYNFLMTYYRLLFYFLLNLLTISVGFSEENQTNKIYLRELSMISKFNPIRAIIEKNIYDVIFQTKKYDLYLLDTNNKNSVFISNYERLTVELFDQEVKVTLSDKIVVIRRYEGIETPILDLRLALYELFFGKNHLKLNKSKIMTDSMKRMEKIKKIAERQKLIKEQDQKTETTPKVAESLQIKNPSPRDKSKDSKQTPAQSISNEPKPKNPKVFSINQTKNQGVVPNEAKTAVDSNPISQEEKKKDESKNQPVEIKPSVFKAVGKINPVKKKTTPPIERKFILSTTAGFVNYTANYAELATTVTNLNFYAMAIIAQSRLAEDNKGDFFDHLDYEISLQLLQPKTTDKFEAPRGKRFFASAMTPHYDKGFAAGFFSSYENYQLVTLREINQGLELVDINFLFLGPEIHFDFELKNYSFNLLGRYKYGLMASSDFEADYQGSAMVFESNISTRKHWGLNIKYEKAAMTSSRKQGTGKASADLLQLAISYKFN